MKKIILILFVFLVFSVKAQESGILFYKGSWNEAITSAKQENKKIFIDFYTEWCGPCLNMALKVFVLPQVGDIYNKHFVCLKIDAEKGEGVELARRYGVNSYPTYIFLDPVTMEVIHRSGSNKPAADFLFDAHSALTPLLGSVYLEKKYAEGNYDIGFIKEYIRYKKAAGGTRDIMKHFDRLIEMGGKLTDPEVWEIYRSCISGYDNPYLKQISDHYSRFTTLFGKKAVDEKLAEATAYAPVAFTESLVDFEGKVYNIRTRILTDLFQKKQYKEAFAETAKMIADSTVDQDKFCRLLSFYVRITPKYGEDDLPFDVVAQKVGYLRYIAYNTYDRDDAMAHYNYALGLEYLICRAQKEGRPMPSVLVETPQYGKKEYDMRHPLLKPKTARK